MNVYEISYTSGRGTHIVADSEEQAAREAKAMEDVFLGYVSFIEDLGEYDDSNEPDDDEDNLHAAEDWFLKSNR